MKLKRKNKILVGIILLIILINNIIPILSIATYEVGNDVTLTSIGSVYPYHLRSRAYNGNYVTTSLAGYYDNGTFYTSYCMNKELLGVDNTRDDTVNLMYLLQNNTNYNKVWRVVTAGYPYHTASELGVSDWTHAYQATKMAIYCVLGQSNVNDFYGTDTEGQQIADLIQRLVAIGENGIHTYKTPVATVAKIGSITLSGEYYIQNYSVSANVQITTFNVIKSNFPNGTIITNTNGNEKTTFNSGEVFQIRIPKNSVETSDINGRIRVDVTSKSFPVFYGKTYNPELQNYAVTGDPLTLTNSIANLELKGNTGKIEITKIDEKTQEPIADTTFQLRKADGTIIDTKTTDSNGKIVFNELYQGSYLLKEITSNENYVLSAEDIRVNATYNQTNKFTVLNKHKTGNLKVYKVDKDNNRITLGNVEFDLYSNEFQKVIDSYKTNVNGEIYIENIRTGGYKLIERNTNQWYNLADETNIEIRYNETTETKVENELIKGQVKIIKVDKDNKQIKLEGVKFNILDKNDKILETVISNSEGVAFTNKYAIRDYESLKVQEIETLKNYVLNQDIQTVILTQDQIT
ncbi:MAG: SpaA isopeptide-forming pilin-related protein, partial [Clostridia bacterium]|nr:SpaA isopeptide-forming pilin-related protein [Clostridia bacterium]